MHLATRAAIAAAALTIATPACAQSHFIYIPVIRYTSPRPVHIGHAVADCLSGKAPKAAEIEDARKGAAAALLRYLRLAGRVSPANAADAFTTNLEMREWWHNGAAGSPAAVDDPLARLLAARAFALPAPDAFYRANDGRAALGVWRVAGDAGTAGHYRALFHREDGRWAVERLDVIEGPADPAPASQFCHVPGDVERRAEDDRESVAAGEAVRLHKQAGRDELHREADVTAAVTRDHKGGTHVAGDAKKSRWQTIAGAKLPLAGAKAS